MDAIGLTYDEAAGNLPWSPEGKSLLQKVFIEIQKHRTAQNIENYHSKTVPHIEESKDEISITILSKLR